MHTQQHTPTLFRMNKPEENNNNNNSGGGSLVDSAAVYMPERPFKEAPGQSNDTKQQHVQSLAQTQTHHVLFTFEVYTACQEASLSTKEEL